MSHFDGGADPRLNPYLAHLYPTAYGRQNHQGFSYYQEDPTGMGASSKLGGAVTGALGTSLLSGIVGGGLGMTAISWGAQGAWKGLGQGGLMTGLRMGAFGAALPYLGMKVATGAGAALHRGAQMQQDFNRMAHRHVTFQEGSQSRTGRGMSFDEMKSSFDMMTDMTHKDMMLSKDELMRTMDKLGQGNYFQGVGSSTEFKNKFKKTVETLKEISKTFQSSLEEAIPLLTQMKHAGVNESKAQQALGLKLRLSGLSVKQSTEVVSQGSQTSRQTGGSGESGAVASTQTIDQLRFASQMKGKGDFYTKIMGELTGGKTGFEAQKEVTGQLLSSTANFLQSNMGRMALAGLSNKDFTGMDEGKVQQLLSGKLSLQKIQELGLENTRSEKNKARFLNREGDLRGKFLEQGGPLAMAGMIRSTLGSNLISNSSDEDLQELIMTRFGTGDRRLAQLLSGMVRDQEGIQQGMVRRDIRGRGLLGAMADRRRNFSMESMRRGFGHRLRQYSTEPIENIGRNIYSAVSNWGERTFDAISRTSYANVTDPALKGFFEQVREGRSELGEKQLGYKTFEGVTDHQISRNPFGSIARWMSGNKDSKSLGEEIEKTFSRSALRSMGVSLRRYGDVVNDNSRFKRKEEILFGTDQTAGPVNEGGRFTLQDQKMSTRLWVKRDSDQLVAVLNSDSRKKLMEQEDARRTGARAAEIVTKYKEGSKVKQLALNVKNKMLADVGFMRKYNRASPEERRTMMQTKFKDLVKDSGSQSLLNEIVNKDYKGNPAGEEFATRDLLFAADAVLQGSGMQSFNDIVTGASSAPFESTAKAKEAAEQGLAMLSEGAVETDFGSMGVFKSINRVSEAVLKHQASIQLTDEERDVIARINTHRMGSLKIAGQEMSEDEVKKIREGLFENKRPEEQSAYVRWIKREGTKKERRKEAFMKWRTGVQAQSAEGIASQLRSAGESAKDSLSSLRGKLHADVFSGLSQTASGMSGATAGDVQRGVEGQLQGFMQAAKSIQGMSTGEQEKQLQLLSSAGPSGKATAMAIRQFIESKDPNKDRLAKESFLKMQVGSGVVAVGDKQGLEVIRSQTEYVKANKDFVMTVSNFLGKKEIKDAVEKLVKRK